MHPVACASHPARLRYQPYQASDLDLLRPFAIFWGFLNYNLSESRLRRISVKLLASTIDFYFLEEKWVAAWVPLEERKPAPS